MPTGSLKPSGRDCPGWCVGADVVFHLPRQFTQRYGPGNAVALTHQTTQLNQALRLRVCFHPFRRYSAAEGFRQANHAFNKRQVLGIAHHVADERVVNSQQAERQAFEVSQGRAAAPKLSSAKRMPIAWQVRISSLVWSMSAKAAVYSTSMMRRSKTCGGSCSKSCIKRCEKFASCK